MVYYSVKHNEKEEGAQLNIQWYPGHMTKTRRQMTEDVKFVDMVAEVVDLSLIHI